MRSNMLMGMVTPVSDVFYFVFRVLVGFMFFTHGIQKFGAFGGQVNAISSLMGVAGVIEIFVGLAIAFGFFTRLAALGGALEMLVAYFMAHSSQGFIPLLNKGELAVMYFAVFLVLMIYGAKRGSLERLLFNREFF